MRCGEKILQLWSGECKTPTVPDLVASKIESFGEVRLSILENKQKVNTIQYVDSVKDIITAYRDPKELKGSMRNFNNHEKAIPKRECRKTTKISPPGIQFGIPNQTFRPYPYGEMYVPTDPLIP